ncbi:uncharacterized protein TRIADDRAFT_20807 [Trichoplax adhaerens]|uniref:Dynein regulatory complex subunit 3 n=1 Tax=Trichoplax adhaerens TaxID=10228 RepID=B3RMW3_TRIAD|nr:hypothetical protein TRIADDRAFT_20807 [Trichoplax adhaerens]EDV27345.1 hypothetical protein TRIADDRAFT_20807 [Trichoplax adhaerens]|eukprot:XP_002109179.1 hypothetical protein TRIADDRAFT_20807 [Trichoplax adhaerens]
MSKLYDTIEPAVIDEQMLKQCVEEQGPKDEAGRIANQEGIDFNEVLHLRLDFKNILKIDNLWSFTNLVRLQLDNNIIEKIEGLNTLVNLKWLDLSFNNIEIIEGLDKLTQLTDLTLFSNRIARIENMDALKELQVVSFGNNLLKSLENIAYLRRFKNLRTINLSGNPFSEDDNYKSYIIAHLPSVIYLDYRLVDESLRHQARDQYEFSIVELEQEERELENKMIKEKAIEERLQKEKRAYVEYLDGPELFDQMVADDPEASKLSYLPGLADKFVELCKEIFQFGLKEHNKREEECNHFFSALNDAKNENRCIGIDAINIFEEFKKATFDDIMLTRDVQVVEAKLQELSDKVQSLWNDLMGLEMQLVDQLEDTIKEFERNMAEMVAAFIEHIQALFAQCRDIENQHFERATEIALETLEKLVKNELEEELPDDLRVLFVDKDTITNAVTASHDAHLVKIDNKEDDMVTRVNNWMRNMTDQVHEDEVKRNRSRVLEVTHLIDHYRDEIDSIESQM